MLPSPSLGAPLLSASMSPAFGPCGIPLELDDFEVVAGADCLGVEVVVAGAGVLLAGAEVVGAAAGVLLVDDEDELLPQPAAMTAATARARNGSPRAKLDLLIIATPLLSFVLLVGTVTWKGMTPHADETSPLTPPGRPVPRP
jgi:hypothetical protein